VPVGVKLKSLSQKLERCLFPVCVYLILNFYIIINNCLVIAHHQYPYWTLSLYFGTNSMSSDSNLITILSSD
ncbi:unnamed protein product, partial [Prunus brigantina]